jgi:hypothetical protein
VVPPGKLTGVIDSTDGAAPVERSAEVWTTRALFARHKLVGICAVALLVLLVATIVIGALGSSPTPVRDSSTCSTWSSASHDQQRAYGQQYLREHHALPSGARDPFSVVAAVDAGCTDAFDNDVQDDITVAQAIKQG